MSKTTRSSLSVDGCSLHVQRSGNGTRTVLLIHGLGDDHTVFPESVVANLAQDHTVLAPDLAGFGQSQAAPDFDFRVTSQARLLASLLTQLGLTEPVTLIGHSLGGAISVLLASASPHQVNALINVEGNLTPEDAFISTHAVNAADNHRFDEWWRLFPAAVRRQNGKDPAIDRYLRALEQTRPETFLSTCRDLTTRTHADEFSQAYLELRVPRLYCLGDHPHAQTRQFLTDHGLPVAHFPGAPHWVIEHAPEDFLKVARSFLTRSS